MGPAAWVRSGIPAAELYGSILAEPAVTVVDKNVDKKGTRAVAEASDVVFTIVGYPCDVEEVTLGENGVLRGLAAGGIVCDMSTSSPVLAEHIAAAAKPQPKS